MMSQMVPPWFHHGQFREVKVLIVKENISFNMLKKLALLHAPTFHHASLSWY